MQTQSPNFEVCELTIYDLEWFVEVAAINMLTDELKRPELINKDNLYRLADLGVQMGTAFVVKKNGFNVGALGALKVPNVYNPEITTLAEFFWYVLPEYRNTRAGLLLLKAFDKKAKEVADEATLSTLPSSQLNVASLEKKGFSLQEFGFRKEYGEIEWPH